jgi:hypothetical protein
MIGMKEPLLLLALSACAPSQERCDTARLVFAMPGQTEASYQKNTGYYCNPFAEPHWPN